jgi:integrase
MSIFSRGKNGIYHYDFKLKGFRFQGTTETTDREQAEAFETAAKTQALEDIRIAKEQNALPLTLTAALDRFWEEVGQHYGGNWGDTIFGALAWLVDEKKSGLNPKVLIGKLTPAMVTTAVAKRRGEGVANSTVNKTVTDLLKQIWLRSRDLWGQRVEPIDWKKIRLGRPADRITSLKHNEEPKLLARMRGDYLPAIRFAIKSGFRLSEIVNLKKKDIDFGDRTITVYGKGRNGQKKKATIPLATELREIVWPLMGNPTDFVFTFIAPRTRVNPKTGKKYIRGQHYPLTVSGFSTAWRRHGAKAAGIDDFRLHDLRHTAATRLAKGGKANIKIVQQMMRHSDIATTAKYMAVYDEDVLAAMEAESDNRLQIRLQLEAETAQAAEAPEKTA